MVDHHQGPAVHLEGHLHQPATKLCEHCLHRLQSITNGHLVEGTAIRMPLDGTTRGAMTPTPMLPLQRATQQRQVATVMREAKAVRMLIIATAEASLKIIIAPHLEVLAMTHVAHHPPWIGTAGIRTRQAQIHTTVL